MRRHQSISVIIGIGISAGLISAQSPAATAPSFEVASIKPSAPDTRTAIRVLPGGRFAASGRLILVVAAAYRVLDYQIVGAPGWLSQDQWTIEAKTAEGTVDPPSTTPPFLNVSDVMAARLRSLLEDRWQLKTHRETKEMQVYALSVGKSGSKLKAVDPPGTPGQTAAPPAGTRPSLRPDGTLPAAYAPPPGSTVAGPGTIVASAITMDQITILLGRLMDYPVIDKTSLRGHFNVKLEFDPATAPRAALGARAANGASTAQPMPDDPAGPSLFTAVQEQLGLKLELKKEPVEVLVIDSIQKPAEN
jgi:bla regulator protein blaR1